MAERADIIIRGGRLIAFDAAAPVAGALAIRGERIVGVGADSEIDALRGPDTAVVDAAGGTVLPGFIESHVHLFQGAAELDALDLTGVAGLDALAAAARGRAAARPDERLIMAVAADYGVLGEGRSATRHDLDAAMPHRPFAMMAADHHTVWANTQALDLAGLLDAPATTGGEVVAGPDGRAAGELREPAAYAPLMALTPLGGREMLGLVTGEDPDPPATQAQRATDKAVIARGLKHCAANGITTLHNMDGNFYQLELLEALEADGDLLCRAQVPFHLKPHFPLERLAEADEMRRRWRGDRLWSGRIKMFMDGVIESRTAFMLDPYPDAPGWRGEALFGAEHFAEACARADALGLQISVHAIGDAAVRRTLDGYQAAREANGARDSRHRIEHIEALHPEDLPRIAALGAIASMQPLHSPRAGFFAPPPPGAILSDEQRPLAFAWAAIRESGARLIFSTDWPVVPLPVTPSIKGAVAGVDLGPPWGDQRQTLREALAAYTRDAAFAEFSESWKGRLAPGMAADVVVMSEDLDATPPEALDAARPALTICAGRVTYHG